MSIFKDGGLRGDQMRALQRQRRLTRNALWAERLTRAFWPAFSVTCFALTFALLGGFGAFGPVTHKILLFVVGLAVAGVFVLGAVRMRTPVAEDVDRRLDDTDPRRPLAVLSDTLASGSGDSGTEAIWLAHKSRARDAAAGLMAQAPDLRLASRDVWAVRLLAPTILIATLVGTGGDWSGRLAAATDPAPAPPAEAAWTQRDAQAEAWITPPAYTGQSIIYLETASDEPVAVPQGSMVTVRVTDARTLPGIGGTLFTGAEAFQDLGGGLAEATGIVNQSGDLVIGHGDQTLATWSLSMIPDAPPIIAVEGSPGPTMMRALELSYSAQDDYGVVAAWAEIEPAGHDPEDARGLPLETINMGLPLPITGDPRMATETSIRDFTAHPWAGAEVELRLYAEDGAGQIGASEPMTITLPARLFSDPLAKALIEQRREIALDFDEAIRVLDVLQAVTRRPEQIFEDMSIYLPVRVAIRRLASGVATDDIGAVAPDVVEILWRAALALEDGDLADALERLRQAQEALREALENGSLEDIRRAMEELRAAMNDYMQQLAQEAMRNPQAMQQQQQQQQQGQQMSQQDLQDMLDRMMEQAESGLRDQAREMLSELSRMLENMQMMAQGQQQQGQGNAQMQELQDMIQRQRDLSDQTFDEMRQRRREDGGSQSQPGQQGQQGQQGESGSGEGQGQQQGQSGQQGQPGQGQGQQPGQMGQQSGPGGGGLAQQQEALRRELEQLSRGVGSEEAARALEEAARAMGEARSDLGRGENADAVRDQMDALDRMNEGAEALAEQIQQGQGDAQAQGQRQGEGEAQDALQNDPFDRPSASFGALDGSSTRVPNQSLIDRARELMEELRRRAAEPMRPEMELDYLDRLMERF